MVDQDLQYKYSDVKQLLFGSEGFLSVGPNPFTTEIEVFTQDRILSVSLYTMLGQVVYQQRYPSSSKIHLGHGLASGTYVIMVETNQKKHIQQVVKTN